jgi:hypothetical protein
MSTRQYVGARYVPKFFENANGSAEWINGVPYEALTVVTYLGNSYTSKKPVPAGINILNTDYWVNTGNYNAQVEEYRKETKEVSNELTKVKVSVGYLKAYVTPQMFGAKADGINDDTSALLSTINYMINNGITNLKLHGRYRITSKVNITIQQLNITGNNTDPACIYCDGENACIEIGDGTTKLYSIIFRDFWIRGNHSNHYSLLTLRNCWNCYFTNFHISDGGANDYMMHFTDKCGIVYFNNCTIEGGSDISSIPADRYGILVDTLGSIFSFTGGNIWNLNTFIKFKNFVNKFNFNGNWVECVKNIFLFDMINATDARYSNISIFDNAFSIHPYNAITIPNLSFLQFIGNTSTNYNNTSISIVNNQIYFWGTVLNNNSLIDFDGGMLNGGTVHIIYKNNVYTGKNLTEINCYVFKNNLSVTKNEIRIEDLTLINGDDFKNVCDDLTLIFASMYSARYNSNWFPNGVNVSSNLHSGDGGYIKYIDGAFYSKYGDKQSLIRQTEYVAITLASQNGFSEPVAYPSSFTKTNTTVVSMKIDYESGRIGQNITGKTDTVFYAETQENGIAIYNNDPKLYGKKVIVMLMKINA